MTAKSPKGRAKDEEGITMDAINIFRYVLSPLNSKSAAKLNYSTNYFSIFVMHIRYSPNKTIF